MPKKAVVVVKPAKRKPAVRRVAVKVAPARTLKAAAPRMKAARNNSAKTYGFRSSSAGSAIGTALGGMFGGPGGAAVGSAVGGIGGTILSKIFGGGDYGVSNAPALKENNIVLANSAQAPQFGTGKVAVNLKHREFLTDVISSHTANTFKIDSYSINPGLAATFPWLSRVVAGNFQQYRINGMAFSFRSMSGDALNSVNTALGQVIMASDYDSADSAFTSKQQMENTEYGVSCKPSTNMIHGIECARSQTSVSELYIRAFANAAGTDVRLYDMATFYIASNGCQGTDVNLGELWVEYDIDVFKSVDFPPGYTNPYAQYLTTAGNTPTAPLGTGPVVRYTNSDNIGLTFTANKIMFPLSIQDKSVWAINILNQQSGAAAAWVPPVVTVGNGMATGGGTVNIPVNAATLQDWGATYYIKYTAGTASATALPYINIANYTWAAVAAISFGDVYVTQVSGLFGGF